MFEPIIPELAYPIRLAKADRQYKPVVKNSNYRAHTGPHCCNGCAATRPSK